MKLLVNNLTETKKFAELLAQAIVPELVIKLDGNLGVGKTTLTRALLQALGIKGKIKSPSFTIVEPYAWGKYNIYHFDLYRFNNSEEWLEGGFDEYFNSGSVCIIEWAQRAKGLITTFDLELIIDFVTANEQARTIEINGASELGIKCLNSLDF